MAIDNQLIAKHISSSVIYSRELAEILKPLFDQREVKYFGYNRYFRNQSWIGLYSDPHLVELDLLAGGGPLIVDAQGIRIPSGSYLHKDLPEFMKLGVNSCKVDDFFAAHNNPVAEKVVQNGLLLVRKGIHYDESFFFSMANTNLPVRRYYYVVINDLKKFGLYFLEKAKKLIEQAEKKPIKFEIPEGASDTFASFFIKHDDEPWIKVKKFCFSTPYGDVFLSHQELNCLRQVAMGRSQEQISEQLDLSRRTVESYLINVKNKLNAESKEELTAYYRAFSIMDGECEKFGS